jgi:hypothetical protein
MSLAEVCSFAEIHHKLVGPVPSTRLSREIYRESLRATPLCLVCLPPKALVNTWTVRGGTPLGQFDARGTVQCVDELIHSGSRNYLNSKP